LSPLEEARVGKNGEGAVDNAEAKGYACYVEGFSQVTGESDVNGESGMADVLGCMAPELSMHGNYFPLCVVLNS
jgi:hypothetical protein